MKDLVTIRPTHAEVNLGAIVDNARTLSALAQTPVLAVVKANAYGHGAVPVARALENADVVYGFAVSLVEEGIELRESGVAKPIVVMGPSLCHGSREVVNRGLTAMVSDVADLHKLAEAARTHPGERPLVFLKFDTGMGRLGIAPSQAAVAVQTARQLDLTIAGLATHLGSADSDDPNDHTSPTNQQLRTFDAILSGIAQTGWVLAANSAALFRFPHSRYNLVRPGLALYGGGHGAPAKLSQAMRLVSKVTQIHNHDRGSALGYGALFVCQRPSKIAIVPVGYADGVPRSLSNRGEVLIAEQRAPIVGAVSMDITMVDVTDVIPSADVGADVTVLGSQGKQCIGLAEFAAKANLLEYEVTCGISRRVPRRYVPSQAHAHE